MGRKKNNNIIESKTDQEFKDNVVKMLEKRDDATLPKDGWPWPWANSKTTDYAYAFVDGVVKYWNYGKPEEGWPDMSNQQNVTLGKRSGVIICSS